MAVAQVQPPRRRGKRFRHFALAALLLLTLMVGYGVYLLRSTPPHWQLREAFLDAHTPEQIDQLADAARGKIETDALQDLDDYRAKLLASAGLTEAEYALPDDQIPEEKRRLKALIRDELKQVRINNAMKIRLSNDELQALVAKELNNWMNDRGYVMPRQITEPMMAVRDRQMILAFKLNADGFEQIFSGFFHVEIHANGYATLKLDELQAGELPVPTGNITQYLLTETNNNPSMKKVGKWLSKLEDLQFKPVLELEHSRRARVQALRALDSGVEVSVIVQDAETYRAENRRLAGVDTNDGDSPDRSLYRGK